MERSNRRDHSRESDDDPNSDTGSSNTRLRSRRMRDARSSAADSTSDGAETDASSVGPNADAPHRRQRHCSSTRKTSEETRKSTRTVDEHHVSPLEIEEDNVEYDVDDTAEMEEDNRGRERSMSNVSNRSSSSSSSLVLEKLTGEQQRARLDQQVAELEQKKKMVEDGTLAEFCRRVAAFKEERNRLLQTAELHKNLQLKNGQDLYQFEVQRAHHLWQNDRKRLQEELLTKVDACMAKLQVEMKALSEPEVRVPGACKRPLQKQVARKSHIEKSSMHVTDSKNDKDTSKSTTEPQQEESEVPEPLLTTNGAPVVKRRKMDPLLLNAEPVDMSKLLAVEVMRLPLDEANADIAAIVGDRKETAKSTVELLPSKGNRKRCITMILWIVTSDSRFVLLQCLSSLSDDDCFMASIYSRMEMKCKFRCRSCMKTTRVPFRRSRTMQSTSSWHQAKKHASSYHISSVAAASSNHYYVAFRLRAACTAWVGPSLIRFTRSGDRAHELLSPLFFVMYMYVLCFSQHCSIHLIHTSKHIMDDSICLWASMQRKLFTFRPHFLPKHY